MDEKKYESARASLIDQFNESGDSPWLEGWICGFTDYESNNDDEMKEKLFQDLHKLRTEKNEDTTIIVFSKKTLDTVGDLIEWLELLGRDRLLIYNEDGNTDSVYPSDICIWDENDPESPVSINAREI